MDEKNLKSLQKKLFSEKESIQKQIKENKDFGLNKSMNESIGELSGYDNHPADIGTELFERGKDSALEENKEHTISLINDALDKIDLGTYGLCEKCKKEIPLERLEALPYAKYCVEHQPINDLSTSRPIEEEILSPPYGRTEFHEQVSESDYDDLYIESDENEGYVEELEGFVITDIYGNPTEEKIDFTKNKAYEDYIRGHE